MLINPDKLPQVSLLDLHLLPETPGLYFVRDGAKRTKYIGKAEFCLKTRFQNHEHMSDFKRAGCDRIAVYQWSFENETEANIDAWEKENIEGHKPIINRQSKGELEPITIEIPEDTDEFLTKYVKLQKQIKQNSVELDYLKPTLVTLIETTPNNKIKRALSFCEVLAYLGRTSKYRFSADTETLMQLVKDKQKQEIEDKIAVISTTTIFPNVRTSALITP